MNQEITVDDLLDGLDDLKTLKTGHVDEVVPEGKGAPVMPEKRKRRTKAEMAQANALALPTVEVADLVQSEPTPSEAFIMQCIANAKMTNDVAEVVPTFEADGTVRRVEFRAAPGVTFTVPGFGAVVWATFTGNLKDFPTFLSNIERNFTVDV